MNVHPSSILYSFVWIPTNSKHIIKIWQSPIQQNIKSLNKINKLSSLFSDECPLSTLHENIRKPKVSWYSQGVLNGNISLKWVKQSENVTVNHFDNPVSNKNYKYMIYAKSI